MITADNVTKQFRGEGNQIITAVDNVSLDILRGEIAVITGNSGSGKTTLLTIIGALSRATTGTVRVLGRELTECSGTELARVRRRIGFVFQTFSLLPRLPVWENVTYPLIPEGVSRTRRSELARDLLDRVGLEQKYSSRPEALSGGEKQRVAVARALVASPQLLVADEPTSNLDTQAANHLVNLFRKIHAQGVTIVISTHDPRMIELGTQVLKMHTGQLRCV